jgi:hypothetical protein
MRDNIRGSIVALIVIGTLSFGSTLRAQGDPLIGHWMLNIAKSKYEGVPAPKSEMRVYEAFGGAGKGIKATFDRVDGAGKKIAVTFSAMYDGKDYKYSGPDGDTIALTRPNPNTLDAVLKRNGQIIQTTHSVISPDGKTRTQMATGTDAQGRKFTVTAVFEKQTTS